MKTLITPLAFAIVIVAPGLIEPAGARAAARKIEPAAAKLGRDSFPSGQNEKCYWWGQCDIIDDENNPASRLKPGPRLRILRMEFSGTTGYRSRANRSPQECPS
jgi:hypothetical protein